MDSNLKSQIWQWYVCWILRKFTAVWIANVRSIYFAEWVFEEIKSIGFRHAYPQCIFLFHSSRGLKLDDPFLYWFLSFLWIFWVEWWWRMWGELMSQAFKSVMTSNSFLISYLLFVDIWQSYSFLQSKCWTFPVYHICFSVLSSDFKKRRYSFLFLFLILKIF